ncbi:MAG: hypothetical protein DRH70_00420 [Candidatus Coatesbacteria bacterium]|nr:MAG: hypothetical protein DRH70_00420 [Candidatus Coatesbacteria bacterium]
MRKVLLFTSIVALTVGILGNCLALQRYQSLVKPLPESTVLPASDDQTSRRAGSESGVLVALDSRGDYIRDLTCKTIISQSAEAALKIVPNWLKMDLYDMFTRMSSDDQEDYGQLLLSISDPRLIDEVAFTIAHSSRAVLSATDPEVYLVNAQLLYRVDPDISYADIVDYGEPGVDADYYSTIIYTTVASGATVQYELPADIYYWYVVHPKLGDENPSMSPVLSDRTSTYGYFWREYLFYNPSSEYDYSLNVMVREPNLLGSSDLSGWNPAAPGYLDSGGIEGVIVGGPGVERPVLIEWAWSYGRVIFTTLELERAAAAGKGNLLENLLMRSSGYNDELLVPRGPGQDQVAILDGSNNSAILDPITETLDRNDVVYQFVSMEEMYSQSRWGYFSKVIIPSHQSYDFYASIATTGFMDNFKWWMSNVGGVMEVHGACDANQSWEGLTLFGRGYVPGPVSEMKINPYPVLGDVIKKATHVWDDSYVNAGLPRYRPFEDNSMAVDVITNWASRMLSFQARGNRPIQPNQICFEHNGNCGEIQDLINAAARTCLVPSAGVNNHTWDHVTCEFWDREWHGYQVGWNVGNASIANQGVLSDKDLGGGKDLSAVLKDRGDTYPINATSRYSKVCHFHVRVEDLKGNPVDCAKVIPYVRYFNKPNGQLVSPLSAFTDSTGELVMDLGNKRDFWFRVKSRVGDVNLTREPLLTNTVADEDYEHTFQVEGLMPHLPPIESVDFPPVQQYSYKILVSYNVDYETQYNLPMSTFGNDCPGVGNIDFFILKSEDFHKYSQGKPFSAYEWRHNVAGDQFEVNIPDEEVYYLVFSNEDTLIVKEFLSIALSVYQNSQGAWVPLEDYSNFLGVPAGHSYVIMFNNRLAPSIYAAGFFNAEVDSSGSCQLGVRAFVFDPNGPYDVSRVELCYGGVPLGKFLRDDGKYDDAIAGDGIFTFSERFMPGTLDPAVYRLEILATDIAGNKSVSWPYLNILSVPLGFSEPTFKSFQTRMTVQKSRRAAGGAPVILGGGFFGRDTVQTGDIFRILAYVDDPDGLSDIDRVELFLEGGLPTGVLLHDDGLEGDDHADDGIYTFQTFMPAGLPTGNLTLEIIAFDKSGNSSATYPYFTVR